MKSFCIGCLLIVALFLSSCSANQKTDPVVLSLLSESMGRSQTLINGQCIANYKLLEQRMQDPATRTRASIWYPKALLGSTISKEMIAYIEELKTALKSETKGDDISKLFKSGKKGKELEAKLIAYKQKLASIDTIMNYLFAKRIVITRSPDSLQKSKEQDDINYYLQPFFTEITTATAVIVLNQFQINIKACESRIAQFCVNKTAYSGDFFDSYSPLIVASSSYVRGGDKIRIDAGVGALSIKAKPQITINGKAVSLNDNGFATYVFEAPGEPGIHYVPVKVIYTDPSIGRIDTLKTTVNYTVAEEGNPRPPKP